LDKAEPHHFELNDAEPNQGLYCQIVMSDMHSSQTLHNVEW